MKSYFKTKNRLKVALDNTDRIEGLQDLLDNLFYRLYEIESEGYFELPYYFSEGSVDYYLNGQRDYKNENLLCQYRPGFHEPMELGSIVKINGSDYEYICSLPLPEEIEHQSEDAGIVYEYRGSSYLRVFLKV